MVGAVERGSAILTVIGEIGSGREFFNPEQFVQPVRAYDGERVKGSSLTFYL
jgi:hypothetical protein